VNQKLKGILVSIGTLVILIILTILVSLVIATTSADGWAGLGALIMMLFATTIVMIIVFVTGIVKYIKDKSQFGLGLIYGIGGIFAFGVVTQILIYTYNMIVLWLFSRKYKNIIYSMMLKTYNEHETQMNCIKTLT